MAGVNQVGAASVMILILTQKICVLEAASNVVQARGSVMTNFTFRRQLVKLASQSRLPSESSERTLFNIIGMY